ncbi:MAG: hypothetical protein GY751_15120 [Bacteroidetes bacterium]|nr:hypothetical protein [Bacteroidota bacterium]
MKLEVTNVWFNAGGDGAGNKPDPTWKISAIVPYINAVGNVCIHRSGVNHGDFSRSDVIFDHSVTPPVWPLSSGMTYIMVFLEAWEDDRGGSCSYNCCSDWQNDDDVHSSGSALQFFYPDLAYPGDVKHFSVTTSSGHFRADLKATLVTQDVYDGAMAVTALDGSNLPVLCEGDNYRVDANVHPNFASYTLQWQRKQGSGSWVNHTTTTNADNIVVTATIPRTDYRARVSSGGDEQDGYRSTTDLNITIGEAPPDAGDISITTPVFCDGETGSVSIDAISNVDQDVSYNFTLSASGITVPNQSSTPANLPLTFTSLPEATYELSVVAANANTNCAAFVYNILVDAASLPTVTNASASDAPCNGQNGSVYVEMSGTSGGTNTYELRQGGAVVYSKASSQAYRYFSNIALGSYDVVVINSNGCESAAQTITIDEPTAVTATATVDPGQGGFNVACNGGTVPVVVNMSGGTGNTYKISGSFGTYSNRTSPATIYLPANGGTNTTIFVRDTRNCQVSIDAGPITEPSASISLSIDNTTATGACNAVGTVDMSASGGAGSFSYFVDGDVANSNSTGSFTGLGGGEHTAYVEDAAGCVVTESFTITQSPSIILSIDDIIKPACFGYNDGSLYISATGGVPPLTYSFDGGDSFSSVSEATGLEAGAYDVVVRDSDPTGSCELSQIITLGEPAEIFVTSIDFDPLICNGEVATLTVNFSEFNATFSFLGSSGEISLDGGGSFQNISPDFPDEAPYFVLEDFLSGSATPYEIMFRNSDGCLSTNTITLTLEDPPVFDFTGTPTSTAETCFGAEDGTITASVLGGRSPYVFTLYNGSGIVAQSDLISPVSSVASVTFTDLTPGMGIGGGYAVGITDGSTLIGADEDCAIVYPSSFNTSTFTLGSGTMISVDEATDLVISGITNTGPALNCLDGVGNNGEVTVSVSGGTEPYEYSSDGVIYQSSNVLTGLGYGPSISVRDVKGCITSQNFYDFEFTPVINTTLTLVEPATTCTKGSIQVNLTNGTGPYIVEVFLASTTLACEGPYLYERGADPIETVSTSQASFIIEDLAAGEYELAIYDETTACLFCSDGTVIVPEVAPVTVTTTKTEESCIPGSDATISFVITGGTAPYTTEINFADAQTGANPTFTGLSSDNPYTFLITDDYGCEMIFVDDVELVSVLDITATTELILCAGEETGSLSISIINGTPPYFVTWNYDQTTTSLNAGEMSTRDNLPAGEYEFSVVDNNGCTAELTAYILEPDGILQESITVVDASCSGVDDGAARVWVATSRAKAHAVSELSFPMARSSQAMLVISSSLTWFL